MFIRPDETYELDPTVVDLILGDPTSPLHRVSQIVEDGTSVLDIGAGNGLLAAVLERTHDRVAIDGIEPNPHAAALAAPRYRSFHVGYAQDFRDEIASAQYDYVVLADVIEHMVDPLAFLRELKEMVDSGTRLLVSVPNVAFAAVRIELMRGRFEYVDSGLLERTHVRFFTLETLETLLAAAGLYVERRVLHQKSAFHSEIRLTPSLLDVLLLARLRKDPLAATYQFFFVLRTQRTAPVEDEVYGAGTTLRQLARQYAAARLGRD
jgi:methionine biosynthesis protein MetW